MKSIRSFISFCFLAYSSFTSAQQPVSGSLKTDLKNITYKVTSANDSVKLDIYQPANPKGEKKPVVLYIHGGGWAKGDKDFTSYYYTTSLKDTLQANGYAFVSINYRLVDKQHNLSDQISDCRDALKWIIDHADTYHFDVDNIGLFGESAGAHLALMLAYTDKPDTSSDFRARYIVDNFGPTDLNKVLKTNASVVTKVVYKLLLPELYNLREKLVKAMTTYDINTQKDQAMAVASYYSPITYIDTAHKIPTLMLHGTKDFIVPIKQSKKLQKALDKHEIENELVKVRKGDHGFRNISKPELQKLLHTTYRFIRQHTGNTI